MPIVAVIAGLAAIVWSAVIARRGSLLVGCGILLVMGYVFGHEYWHARVGPIPVTIDRLFLGGLLVAALLQRRLGQLRLKQPVVADWLLLGLIALFTASILANGGPVLTRDGASAWGRLVASFGLPAVLYAIARQVAVTRREWGGLLVAMVILGIYLSLTAILESTGKWTLVFPQYIADSQIGIHFGRARGPGLNAASLGIYLTACLGCGWTLLCQATRRGTKLMLLLAMPFMAVGVFLTYTRSTWMGLAASALVVAWYYVPRKWRIGAVAIAGLCGVAAAAASWNSIVGLQREGTGAESHHSVDQRASFAYVSWQMFQDYPLFGVGFGRFYDRKLPYLSDRRQDIELESIRSLEHHNTFLGILTETGTIGLSMFVGLLIAWASIAWALARDAFAPGWIRSMGVLLLALMTSYGCSALFHDLTLIPAQQVLLFLFAGLTVNAWQGEAVTHRTSSRPSEDRCNPAAIAIRQPPASELARMFGMRVSRITMQQAVDRVLEWCNGKRGDECRYIVTPNVDHAVMFFERPLLRAAYADASLVLADGAPIVFASRLLGQGLPERVAGSDLVPRILMAAQPSLRVYLLGAAPGVADHAAANIRRQWPQVEIVGSYSPPSGFEHDSGENDRILRHIAEVAPDLLIIGLGAPKQELWVHRHRHELRAKVAICAGATIDFLAGHRRRSPIWMRRIGLEWIHRLIGEPRRLAGRYARDLWVFPQLVWREWRQSRA
jgi:N-acetylglucosaminyldiphosphoundecaprenol N-acetyl-beta-D-mannosaminyltransferase